MAQGSPRTPAWKRWRALWIEPISVEMMGEEEKDFITGRCATTRQICMPAEANAAGDIFGGWIVSQIDIAGAIVAAKRAQGRIVTVALDSVQFHYPVFIGDVISCFARITKVGRTSITVHVEVYAERHPDCVIRVTEAKAVYVAIDSERRPRPVPPE